MINMGRLPYGTLFANITANHLDESTWAFWILPYIDQQALFDMVNPNGLYGFGMRLRIAAATTERSHAPPSGTLICPSNPPLNSNAIYSESYARGTYAANNGYGPMTEFNKSSPPLTRDEAFLSQQRDSICRLQERHVEYDEVAEIIAVNGEDARGTLHYIEGAVYHYNNTPNSSTADIIRKRRLRERGFELPRARAPSRTPRIVRSP